MMTKPHLKLVYGLWVVDRRSNVEALNNLTWKYCWRLNDCLHNQSALTCAVKTGASNMIHSTHP